MAAAHPYLVRQVLPYSGELRESILSLKAKPEWEGREKHWGSVIGKYPSTLRWSQAPAPHLSWVALTNVLNRLTIWASRARILEFSMSNDSRVFCIRRTTCSSVAIGRAKQGMGEMRHCQRFTNNHHGHRRTSPVCSSITSGIFWSLNCAQFFMTSSALGIRKKSHHFCMRAEAP